MHKLIRSEEGFSLLELLLAISITSVLLLVLGNFMGNGIISSNRDYNKTLIQSNTKLAVDTVARTIKSAVTVEAQNTQPDNNGPGAPGNLYGWSGVAGNNSTLILAVPARTSSGSLIYIDGLHTTVYTNDIIFYLNSSDHRLYKRVLANAVVGNAAKTTCPPAAATSTCPSDAIIVEDIASLSTAFYDNSDVSIASPTGTEAVGYTVTESKILGGKTFSSSYSTIAALRNK
jgi:prepilin-type N-terminal cleavage/methylation domain-containing protein